MASTLPIRSSLFINSYQTQHQHASNATIVQQTNIYSPPSAYAPSPEVTKKTSGIFTRVLNFFLPINSVTKHREIRLVPKGIEVGAGSMIYPLMIRRGGGYYNKKIYQTLLDQIGANLTQVVDRKLPYQFSVLASNDLNAWCLPGGKIAFYKGLIEKMEQETDTFGVGKLTLEEKMAAVVGHEITHAAARHSARTLELSFGLLIVSKVIEVAMRIFITQKLKRHEDEGSSSDILEDALDILFDRVNWFILEMTQSHYSRKKELEADKYGMLFMKRAGYDPKAAIWLQKFFVKHQPKTHIGWVDKALLLFRSHPYSEDRVKANEKTLEELNKNILV